MAGFLLRRQHRRGRVRLPASRLLPVARPRHSHGHLCRLHAQCNRGRDRFESGGRPCPVQGASRLRDEGERGERGRPWGVHLAIALSGMSALGAEVVWTRLLSLLLGGTVYTFSLILAVFLIGLGIGSSLGAFLAPRVPSARVAFGICQWLLTAAIAWSAVMISESLPYWPIVPGLSPSPWYTFQLDLVRCLWAVLPPACVWGASFPLALMAVACRGQDPGRLVGGVYAANTIGAIAGALVFSLLLVPAIGTAGAERVLIGLAAAAALVALMPLLRPATGTVRLGRAATSTAAMGVAVWLAWIVTPAPWVIVAFGRQTATWLARSPPASPRTSPPSPATRTSSAPTSARGPTSRSPSP